MKFVNIITLSLCWLMIACSAKTESKPVADNAPTTITPRMEFNADSAYRNVQAQVDFGPRVPGMDSHAKCARYLVNELKRFGADSIIEQKTTVTAFNGDKLPINNIMGQFNKDAVKRVLLLAHWDTRPWADAEADASKHSTPIDGANDGGSGVGVLLEIARCLGVEKPTIGVDILFVDAEDYGQSQGDDENTWCLGTQNWIKNLPYTPGSIPEYGILLDMVGGKDAKFHREYASQYLAGHIVDKVWTMAVASGYGNVFVNEVGGSVMDDHVYVNQANIPCIDIIENNNPSTSSFNPTWHTLNDNMSNIDRQSLKAVGQTVLNLIYQEN
ncbi:MAG: M28 family peptidase [Muribaculaceae bacterium]|nr:M28 family peptidase [Muribaculaceae bacterium]